MRRYEVLPSLQKALQKLLKKDKVTYEAILKKVDEVINAHDIHHYKNLRFPLQKFKRVHINGPFVLIFTFIEDENKIVFFDLDYHDNIYRKSH